MAKKKLFIRFGHEILTNGSITAANPNPGPGELREYDFIREYADYLVGEFAAESGLLDIKVWNEDYVYDDKDVARNAGIKAANEWGADFFISCHGNVLGGASGTETIYKGGCYQSEILARKVNDAMVGVLGLRDRGIKIEPRKDFIPDETNPRLNNAVAIILEPIALDNSTDCSAYKEVGPRKLARAIKNAAMDVFF